jgi:hypothetical protein
MPPAAPFLLIFCKNAKKKQSFSGWYLSNVMNDSYRGDAVPFLKKAGQKFFIKDKNHGDIYTYV